MDQEYFLSVRESAIHCLRFGSGNKLLLCFHGFGDEAEKFRVLEPALGNHYTVVAIDLPFHGKTEWKSGEYFHRHDLKSMIDEILQRESRKRFSLMGYSLGGKIVFAAIDLFAPQIDAVILAAPDGIKVNAWYNLAVYPKWGQRLFNRFVKKPQFVFSTANMLKSMGIINERLHKFLQVQTDTEEKRQKVHDVWITIKDFETNLQELKSTLNRYAIKSYIFIGRYDRVITTKIGEKFAAGLHSNKYVILEKGHNLITESFNDPLKKALGA